MCNTDNHSLRSEKVSSGIHVKPLLSRDQPLGLETSVQPPDVFFLPFFKWRDGSFDSFASCRRILSGNGPYWMLGWRRQPASAVPAQVLELECPLTSGELRQLLLFKCTLRRIRTLIWDTAKESPCKDRVTAGKG